MNEPKASQIMLGSPQTELILKINLLKTAAAGPSAYAGFLDVLTEAEAFIRSHHEVEQKDSPESPLVSPLGPLVASLVKLLKWVVKANNDASTEQLLKTLLVVGDLPKQHVRLLAQAK